MTKSQNPCVVAKNHNDVGRSQSSMVNNMDSHEQNPCDQLQNFLAFLFVAHIQIVLPIWWFWAPSW